MGVQDSYVRFTLRIPEELKMQLKKLAKQNHRSLNSELIILLQNACDEAEGKSKQ